VDCIYLDSFIVETVSGGTRVGLLEYSFPNKKDVLFYFEKHLKLRKEVSAQIYTYVGGHLGEVGKVIARFQGSEPTAKDVSVEFRCSFDLTNATC
jgi:hypothetical protein